jgi:hypothetical protein
MGPKKQNGDLLKNVCKNFYSIGDHIPKYKCIPSPLKRVNSICTMGLNMKCQIYGNSVTGKTDFTVQYLASSSGL